jgi:hypothetical protein
MSARSAPAFTQKDIDAIVAALPPGTDKRRLRLLPRILREWRAFELREYRERPSRTKVSATRQKYARLRKCAEATLKALSALDDDERFELSFYMGMAQRGSGLQQEVLIRRATQLKSAIFLHEIDDAVSRISKSRRYAVTYLTLLDVGGIFEWLTGARATRIINPDTGKDVSPFSRFAAALWPSIFGEGDKGLPSAIRRLAEGSAKHGDVSPLLANISFRRPRWKIFGKQR